MMAEGQHHVLRVIGWILHRERDCVSGNVVGDREEDLDSVTRGTRHGRLLPISLSFVEQHWHDDRDDGDE